MLGSLPQGSCPQGSLTRWTPRAGLLALVVLLAASGPLWAQEESLVQVDRVKREPLAQTVPVFGRLVARQAGDISARINGPVARFHVEVGDRVAENDVIAELDQQLLQARRDLAASGLSEFEAAVKTSRAEATLARQALKRLEKLKSSAAFSQARYDDARQSLVIAEARVHRSLAAVSRAQAELQVFDINLADATVRAPYAGVVTHRLSEAGAYVQIGQPLVRLLADRSLEIEAEVPFQRLSGLTGDRPLRFTLDDGSSHDAMLRAVLPTENPLTRTRMVRLEPHFSDTAARLADSQSVTVMIPAGAERDVLTVHKDAILRRQGDNIVYVVEAGTAMPRTLAIGEGHGSRIEVLSGLEEGDMVVVRGNERLHPGAKVRIAGDS